MFALFSNQFIIYLLVLRLTFSGLHDVFLVLRGLADNLRRRGEERKKCKWGGRKKNTVDHVNECELLQGICECIFFLSAVKRGAGGVVSSESAAKEK